MSIAAAKAGGSPSAEVLRQLKIKTGAVKRLVKEREVDLREVDEQRVRIEQMHGKEGVDDADIRKQNEVLEEALRMIPYTERRIRTAVQDLDGLVQATKEDGRAAKELDDADAAISAARRVVPTATD